MKNQKDGLDPENAVQCGPEDPDLNLIDVLAFSDLQRGDFSGKTADLIDGIFQCVDEATP